MSTPEHLIHNETEPHFSTPVIVVGGGLSGLVLGQRLTEAGVGHIILEASGPGKGQAIHYLTSKSTAASLGLLEQFEHAGSERVPITGYVRFDGRSDTLTPLEELPPSPGREGFATFSIAQLRSWLPNANLRMDRSVSSMTQDNEGNWALSTSKGEKYKGEIIIDATGTRAKVLRMSGVISESDVANRPVRTCYGGVFSYDGPEDRLLFVDRFPTLDGISPEAAGWIMPLGNRLAEVVVGWEGSLRDGLNWRSGQISALLQAYIEWFNQRGVAIDPKSRTQVISGAFSEGLLDYRKIKKSNVVAFGESAGLNHPLNGYLIGDISHYAEILTREIQAYLSQNNWHPYESLVRAGKINYGLERALGVRKTAGATSGEGRSSATRRLQELLLLSLGSDGLWQAIDSGVPLRSLVKGLLRHPQYSDEVVRLGWSYLQLLFEKDQLYLRELRLRYFPTLFT